MVLLLFAAAADDDDDYVCTVHICACVCVHVCLYVSLYVCVLRCVFLQIKSDIAYANSKGIEVGGYDIIALSRTVPEYWRAVGGEGACMASGWSVCMCVCVCVCSIQTSFIVSSLLL